jgi:hypothetical protein
MSRKTIRYLVVSLLWAVAFTVTVAALAGCASGLLFGARAADGGNPAGDAELIAWAASAWQIAPPLGCALALLLCALGRLPGTKLDDPPPNGPPPRSGK